MNYLSPKLLPKYEPISSLEKFSSLILNNPKKMSPQSFAYELSQLQKHYLKSKQRDLFCSEAGILADKLAEQNNHDFAGIIISALCKLTQFFPEQLEPFAIKGFHIAKANGDYIHMMARLNDLRKIYFRRPEKLREYLKILYKQEKCLKELTCHYTESVDSYKTLGRSAADKKQYIQMLAHIQTEIAKLTKRKHPQEARTKLLSARELFNSQGNHQHLEYINMLLSEIV